MFHLRVFQSKVMASHGYCSTERNHCDANVFSRVSLPLAKEEEEERPKKRRKREEKREERKKEGPFHLFTYVSVRILRILFSFNQIIISRLFQKKY